MSALTGKMPRAEMNQELLLGLAALLAVDCALEHGARNKLRNVGLRNRDRFASSGITASASRANLLLKGAEANERNVLALLQSGGHSFHESIEGHAGLSLGNVGSGCDLLNQIILVHRFFPYEFILAP